MLKTIKQVLITRGSLTPAEADILIADAKEDLNNRLEAGEMPFDICYEWFGLEEDYLEELMD
jgi:hypothetical protein